MTNEKWIQELNKIVLFLQISAEKKWLEANDTSVFGCRERQWGEHDAYERAANILQNFLDRNK